MTKNKRLVLYYITPNGVVLNTTEVKNEVEKIQFTLGGRAADEFVDSLKNYSCEWED